MCFHSAGVTSRIRPHLARSFFHSCLQSLLGYLHLSHSRKKKFSFLVFFNIYISFQQQSQLHLLQWALQLLQTRSKARRHQLSDAVSVAINNVQRGAAAVVAVQRGGALQADWKVAGLTEETELLARVHGAQDGTAETTSWPQLLQTLNRMRRCSLLPPAEPRQNK